MMLRPARLSEGRGADRRLGGRTLSVAFLPIADLHLPHNNREYYLSRELEDRGWKVHWLRPASGTNQGVAVGWSIIQYPDLELRGRKYLLPVYLAWRLRRHRIRLVWISGWTFRDLGELHWLVRILTAAGVGVAYDPIDPICEFAAAQADPESAGEAEPSCIERARGIYRMCDLTVCVTPQTRKMLIDHGAPGDRLMVGRWGTDAALFDPARVGKDLRDRFGIPRNRFVVGWLGTMERFKGLFELTLPLIEALGDQVENMHFVLAGRGTLAPTLRQWARERPHLPVSILPPVPYEEAAEFTAALDTYLVPTNPRTEYARSICPIKCFDALAMGTPLIVTRTDATLFLEKHGDLVELVDFDEDAVKQALLRIQRSDIHSRPRARRAIREYSHQQTSVVIADAMKRVLG